MKDVLKAKDLQITRLEKELAKAKGTTDSISARMNKAITKQMSVYNNAKDYLNKFVKGHRHIEYEREANAENAEDEEEDGDPFGLDGLARTNSMGAASQQLYHDDEDEDEDEEVEPNTADDIETVKMHFEILEDVLHKHHDVVNEPAWSNDKCLTLTIRFVFVGGEILHGRAGGGTSLSKTLPTPKEKTC